MWLNALKYTSTSLFVYDILILPGYISQGVLSAVVEAGHTCDRFIIVHAILALTWSPPNTDASSSRRKAAPSGHPHCANKRRTSTNTLFQDSYCDVFKLDLASKLIKCSCFGYHIVNGLHRTKTERKKEYRRTGVDPEYVLYYDLASGSFDVRPIGDVYGVMNLYRDASNPSNVNEVEEKLSILERGASVVIGTLHSDLTSGSPPLNASMLSGCGNSYS